MKVVIINSSGFWSMGWATDPDSQLSVIESLKRLGVEVSVHEVASKVSLEALLSELKGESCLVWPNAYQVYIEPGKSETLWLADVIDSYGLPMIGSNATALRNVLDKSQCQHLLGSHNVPIPAFAAVHRNMLDDLAFVCQSRNLNFPLFVKPDSLSTSKGITQDCVVHQLDTLAEKVKQLGDKYGYPVMVEEFLPGRDITVAVFMTPGEPVILATYYDIEIYDDPGAVLDHSVRLRDWDDGKWLTVVTEPDVLEQIKSVVLPACKAVGISEFTRIDCRLDRNGQLKAFDVNGLPGLELPFSTTVWQMLMKLPDIPQHQAFDVLISLVVYCAVKRHNISAPSAICALAEDYIAAERAVTSELCS